MQTYSDLPSISSTGQLKLTPAQVWAAWHTLLTRLYARGYAREQVAEWTGIEADHALIRHYSADNFLRKPSRAWRHCMTPPWERGACNKRIVAALECLLDMPPPFEHISYTTKSALYVTCGAYLETMGGGGDDGDDEGEA
jgi:hypothetical protein